MSILQLPPSTIEPSASDAHTSGGSSGAGSPQEAPFASLLHDERVRERDDVRGRTARSADDDRVASAGPDGPGDPDVDRSDCPGDATTKRPIVDPAAALALLAATPADTAATELATAPATAAADASAEAATAGTPAASGAPASIAAAAATPLLASVAAQAASDGPATPPTASLDDRVAAPGGGGANPQSAAPRATPVQDSTTSQMVPDGPQAEASADASPAALAAAPAGPASATSANAPSSADAALQAATVPSSPTTVPAVAVAAQPLDSPAAASATLPARGVGLDRAVETVRLALRAPADRGVTHARISLNPRELGGIEIHLRHTAEGLVARVVAEHAGAAQLLQHAGAELRRSLEAQGVTLLQLDIGASGDQDGRTAGEQRGFGEAGARRGAATDPAADADDGGSAAPGAPNTVTDSTLALANGVLVDVLA